MVTFYHTARADGGRRTGVEVRGRWAFERFVPCDDPDEADPVIRWSVDLTWAVDDEPRTVTEARAWYAAHEPDVRAALEAAADRLEAGLDREPTPHLFEVPTPIGPARAVVTVQRRVDGRDVAAGIRAVTGELAAVAEEAACPAG